MKGEIAMAKPKESQEASEPTQSQPQLQGDSRPNDRQSSETGQEIQSRGGQQTVPQRRESPLSTGLFGGPFGLMRQFAGEIDRLFEEFGFGRGRLAPRGFGGVGRSFWSPQVEVFESKGQIVVRADLPGLNKDDIKVDVTDNVLTLQGERRQESEGEREGWYSSERSYGSFYRTIPLPEGVNAEEIQASFNNGVLEVKMPAPREKEHGGHQIEVK
jgi:HSP20 family protein